MQKKQERGTEWFLGFTAVGKCVSISVTDSGDDEKRAFRNRNYLGLLWEISKRQIFDLSEFNSAEDIIWMTKDNYYGWSGFNPIEYEIKWDGPNDKGKYRLKTEKAKAEVWWWLNPSKHSVISYCVCRSDLL